MFGDSNSCCFVDPALERFRPDLAFSRLAPGNSKDSDFWPPNFPAAFDQVIGHLLQTCQGWAKTEPAATRVR
jgi:hypothetical protein